MFYSRRKNYHAVLRDSRLPGLTTLQPLSHLLRQGPREAGVATVGDHLVLQAVDVLRHANAAARPVVGRVVGLQVEDRRPIDGVQALDVQAGSLAAQEANGGNPHGVRPVRSAGGQDAGDRHVIPFLRPALHGVLANVGHPEDDQ